MNSAELTAIATVGSAALVLVGVLIGNRTTAKTASTTNAREELTAALDRVHSDLSECNERRRLAELSAEVAHIRADEADVRASEAEGLASGLAWRLEQCEARERVAEAAEALRVLDDVPPVPPD